MYNILYKKNYRCLTIFLAAWMLFGIEAVQVKAQSTDATENHVFVRLTSQTQEKTQSTDTTQMKRTVTGPYGDVVDKAHFLGSESTIYTDQLTNTLATTIIPGLAGRMAGLNISQYRGARIHYTSENTGGDHLIGSIPLFGMGRYGDNTEFNISSRKNSPIAIVDGIERDLYSIDPEIIESVSIQKDALSSMFLGMHSSRGALIITTKNPTKGNLQLSFTGKYGILQALKTPKPLSSHQYAYLLNEALENDGNSAIYSYDDFAAFRDGTNPYTHPDENWYDHLLKNTATTQSYNLNVSGGNEYAQYIVNLGYMNEEGLFRTSSDNSYNTNLNYERYLISSKVNINVTKDFKATVNIMGRIEDGNQPGGSGNGYSDMLSTMFATPNGAYPVKNPDGSWGGNLSFNNNLVSQAINSGYLTDNARDMLGTVNLTYDFDQYVKGLSIRAIGSVSSQIRSAVRRTKQAAVYAYRIDDTDGSESYTMYSNPSSQVNEFKAVSTYNYLYGQFSVDYKRQFGIHGLNASLRSDTRNVTTNYDLPEIPSNIMANVAYNYAGKYFAQAALTESYYNRYAPDNRWGTFYAFGLGWDISKESFMKTADWLDQLKFRGTFGKTGNGMDNAGYYSWRQTYYAVGTAFYPLGTSQTSGTFVYENNPLANPNISWEKAYKTNVGVDISVLNNHLQLSADYYNDKYFDLLQFRGKNIELMGSAYPFENIGKVRCYGTELELTYQNNAGRFNYYVTANWSREQSKVLYMDEQEVPYDYLRRTGQPAGAFFGLVADGFLTAKDIAAGYPVIEGFNNIQPGDIKYVDMNKDGIIDVFDSQVIGGDKPLSYFGVDLGFEYRGFELSMLWQGVYNRDIYLGDRTLTEGFQSIGQSYGQAYEHLLNRWTPETATTAAYPRLSAGGNEYNQGNGWNSSFWLKSGNFLRLKNLTVAYNLPKSVCSNYFGNMRVKLFATGQNMLTVSAIDMIDPEVSFTSYPMQRCFNFGINIKF